MHRRRLAALPLLPMFLMLLAQAAWAQRPLTRDEAMELLAAGSRWVELEGDLQPDGTFVAKEIDIVAAEDSLSMLDVVIGGTIATINRRFSKLTVLSYEVTWNETTKIRDADKHQVLSSKLNEGQGIKVKGKLQEDGTFLARSIQLTAGKPRSDGTVKYKQQLRGPATVVDARDGLLRVVKSNVTLRGDCTFFENPVEVQTSDEKK